MNLKELRIEKKVKQITLSKYFGIPLRTIQHWELGDRIGSKYVTEKLLTCLSSLTKDQMLAVGYVNQDGWFAICQSKEEAMARARKDWANIEDKKGKRIVSGVFTLELGKFTGLNWEIFEVLS